MKYHIIIFIVFSMFFLSCKKEYALNPNDNYHDLKLVNDELVYEILNHHIAADSSYDRHSSTIIGNLHPLLWDRTDSMDIIKADTIFLKEDAAFISNQIRSRHHLFKIEQHKLSLQDRNVIFLDEDRVFSRDNNEYFAELREKHGTFFSATIPVFSADKKTAMIATSYNCGMLCGFGATYIYKKDNAKWKLIAVWNKWVS
jgi:hypothetical protein